MTARQLDAVWAVHHVDAVVTLAGDAWRIIGTTTTGAHVLLRDPDDSRSMVASAAAVRRAYLADNS